MNEHDSKVEVIEKHYHGNQQHEAKTSGDGKSIAALVTSIATAAATAIPLIGGAIKQVTGGGSSGGSNGGVVPQIVSAVAPMFAAAAAPRQTEPRFIPVPIGGGHECSEMAEMRAKIAKLEAEKYSDNAAKEESNRLLQNYLKPYGQEIADSRVREARMSAEIECLKKTQELELKLVKKDIELAKQEAACCCKMNSMLISSIDARLNSVTKVVIPNSANCPGWGNVTITPAAATTTAG